MNQVNLFMLTRIKDDDVFSLYENIAANRIEYKKTEVHEQESLHVLVDEILKYDVNTEDLDGFYFSYVIQHISKEFDLLKISQDFSSILNIELKSEPISTDKIKKQLIRNKYYLGHLSCNINSFTYIASSSELYNLDKDRNLNICDFKELIKAIKEIGTYFTGDIDTLFKAANFLISPLNTPDKFLSDNYFLTNQQEEIKSNILKKTEAISEYVFISIKGEAGTGKTLLLYDVAKYFSNIGKVCIIHCGLLSDGHVYLNKLLPNIEIIPIKSVNIITDFEKFNYIFLDETQRVFVNQFEMIKNAVIKNKLICIFSYDPMQILSQEERNRNIDSKISSLSMLKFNLTDKIRTNKETISFIRTLLNLNKKDNLYNYNNVDIVYASNKIEALKIIKYYKKQNFTFINFTSSNYNRTPFDFCSGDYNTHKVIGQEFDNVLMLIDKTFYYNENNILYFYPHPNPNYLYDKLLFQGLTRTKERLCIIVLQDMLLFEKILSIKSKTLHRECKVKRKELID